MRFSGRGSLVWLGMVLTGLALGAYVFAVWPDTTSHLVPLPYGESMPKTPVVHGKGQPGRSTASVGRLSATPEPAGSR